MTGSATLTRDNSDHHPDADSPLALRLSIHLDEELGDLPGHAAGNVSGTVSFDPIGGDRPIVRGRFELFGRSGPRTYTMTYRLVVSGADGGEISVDGSKLLHSGHLLRVWPETTTLPVRISPAPGSGPGGIDGAGTVRIHLSQLVPEVLSLRGDGPTPVHRLAEVVRFTGSFFAGLFVIYVVRFLHPAPG